MSLADMVLVLKCFIEVNIVRLSNKTKHLSYKGGYGTIYVYQGLKEELVWATDKHFGLLVIQH